MRLILDTNILISALITMGGLANRLWEAWRITRFTLITSEEQFDEFRRVTRYPRLRDYIQPADAGTMLNELRSRAIVLTDLPAVKVSSDPADDFLLAMAGVSHADYWSPMTARTSSHWGATAILELSHYGKSCHCWRPDPKPGV